MIFDVCTETRIFAIVVGMLFASEEGKQEYAGVNNCATRRPCMQTKHLFRLNLSYGPLLYVLTDGKVLYLEASVIDQNDEDYIHVVGIYTKLTDARFLKFIVNFFINY